MKNFNQTVLITVFVLIGSLNSAYTREPIRPEFEKSVLEHLVEINQEWKNHTEACPAGMISFSSDIDRIQLHLNLVVQSLRSNCPYGLDLNQTRNRMLLIKKLEKYANARVFPVNQYHQVRQPYFVDDFGTNCAVGQLIHESGNQKLVSLISEEHNYDYIEDIQTEGLTEWANEFGFTIDELKWIQPGYPPSNNIDPIQGGTNGAVTEIVYNPYDASILIGGSFTELNNLPCLNVGYYKADQLNCFGNGVNGFIEDLIVESGEIYCFGELFDNGITYPAAKFDGSTWSYIGIPNRDNATCTAANYGGSGYQIELAINHSSIPGKQEIWHLLNDGNWVKQAEVNGIILDIIASNHGRVHAGHFDTVSVYNQSGLVDSVIAVHNVVIKENYSTVWFGIGSAISDTVNVIKNIGGGLIFGGTCGSQAGESNICLSRYLNGSLQTLYYSPPGNQWSINSIAYNNGSVLIIGGEFTVMPMIGTYGNNLASYHLVYNSIEAMGNFDNTVDGLAYLGPDLYIGGQFYTNMSMTLNHLGRIISTASIEESISESDLTVYPNPFTSFLNIEGIANGVNYSLLNVHGQVILTGTVENTQISGLEFISSGTYLLRFDTPSGIVVRQVIK